MSQMNPRRRSTVHDLASLRLHRDGTRVLNSDTNRSSRRAKHAVRDVRGNWVAQDAGGLGNVKQRRNTSQPDEDNASESEDAGIEEEATSSPKDKGKARAHEEVDSDTEHDLNPRARKRRRFDEDLGYLASQTSSALVPQADSEQPLPHGEGDLHSALPVPSSDLLKCLHYFASTYYTAMGQLYDASREFRKQKKARRAEKSKAALKSKVIRSASSKGSNVHEAPHSSGEEEIISSDAEDDDPIHEDPVEKPATGTGAQVAKTARKRGRRQVRPMEKDMYRVFDGSALMALGMLFQEHVTQAIEPRVSDTWEAEMVVVERNERKEAKNARKAKEMRDMRHPVKDDLGGREDEEGELSPESEGEQQSSEETESDDEVESGSVTRNVALKRHSSVAIESGDNSD